MYLRDISYVPCNIYEIVDHETCRTVARGAKYDASFSDFSSFFLFRRRRKKRIGFILKVNLAGLHLNRIDNLWLSARVGILRAIKRSLWAYNVTYSPCNFVGQMQRRPRRIEPAHASRRIFFTLAARALCAQIRFQGIPRCNRGRKLPDLRSVYAPRGPRNSRVSARQC